MSHYSNGMLHDLVVGGLIDTWFIRAHTEGFDARKSTVREYTPKFVAEICGIAEDEIIQAAHCSVAPTAR